MIVDDSGLTDICQWTTCRVVDLGALSKIVLEAEPDSVLGVAVVQVSDLSFQQAYKKFYYRENTTQLSTNAT